MEPSKSQLDSVCSGLSNKLQDCLGRVPQNPLPAKRNVMTEEIRESSKSLLKVADSRASASSADEGSCSDSVKRTMGSPSPVRMGCDLSMMEDSELGMVDRVKVATVNNSPPDGDQVRLDSPTKWGERVEVEMEDEDMESHPLVEGAAARRISQLYKENSALRAVAEDNSDLRDKVQLLESELRFARDMREREKKIADVAPGKRPSEMGLNYLGNDRGISFRGFRNARGRGRFGNRGRGREGPRDGRPPPRAWNEFNNGEGALETENDQAEIATSQVPLSSILKPTEKANLENTEIQKDGKPTVSWADMVRGEEIAENVKKMKLKFVEPTKVGGRVRVSPPKAVAEKGASEWENSLVGYFIDKRLPYPVVNSIAHKLWDEHGLIEVLVNETGFFFFRFNNGENREEVLEKGPWHFAGRHLVLKKWTLGMRLSKDSLNKLPVWVQLHNVPVEYWTEEGLSYVASAVGRPLCADSLTENKKRISYARICVEVEAKQALVDEFDLEINGDLEGEIKGEVVVVKVEYQWKPFVCTKCCVFGHSDDKCYWHNEPKAEEIRQANQWQQQNNRGKSVVVYDEPPETVSDPILVKGSEISQTKDKEAVALSGEPAAACVEVVDVVATDLTDEVGAGSNSHLSTPMAKDLCLNNMFEDLDIEQDPDTASPDLNPLKNLINDIDGPVIKRKGKKGRSKGVKSPKNKGKGSSSLPYG